jgi:hypothetical protein
MNEFEEWVRKAKSKGFLDQLAARLDEVWGNCGTAPVDPTTAAIALGEQLTIRRCAHFIRDPFPKPAATLPPPTYGISHE